MTKKSWQVSERRESGVTGWLLSRVRVPVWYESRGKRLKWLNIAVIKVKLRRVRIDEEPESGIEIVYPGEAAICYAIPRELDKFLEELMECWDAGAWRDIDLRPVIISHEDE